MRAIALLCALCALAGGVTAAVTSGASAAERTPDTRLAADIGRMQQRTWRLQLLMGERRTPSSFSAARSTDPAYRRWVLRLWQHRFARVERRAHRWMSARVRVYQARVDHWRRVMGAGPLRLAASAGGGEAAFLRWRRLARQVLRQAANPPHEAAWRCIHRYEGSWTDANAPYYGGLQMDIGFQRRYGRYLLQTKGTADHWTPLEQMWVAARAQRSGRGFHPWPNTARSCGLI